MSILLERILITTGLKSEGMCEEDPKKKKQNGGQTQQSGQSPEMPMMQMPMMPMMQMPQKPMNTSQESREMPEMNMNFGINEPVASNEMGCSFVNY
jgi:hypothetical protein